MTSRQEHVPPTPNPEPHDISAVVRPDAVVADAFFAEVTDGWAQRDAACAVITHVLPGQMNFLAALSKTTQVTAVLPKPKSADRRALDAVAATYRCDPLDRGRFADPEWLGPYLEDRAAGHRLVLSDIGGYFAPALAEVCATAPGLIAGIVEDTENGLRRYEALDHLPCPVYSVARSPLKEPEDRLVGEAIVFSVESLLRRLGEVLPGRQACVLGFGKIGAGIAAALHARHVQVLVYDTDPMRQVQAATIGYDTATWEQALAAADLVLSATGSRAIGMEHLGYLRDGAFLAAATSGDDEFDLAALASHRGEYTADPVIPGVVRYTHGDHWFHLLGNGNAVNFLHTSALGPAIHMIKAEIVTATDLLAAHDHAPGFYEVSAPTRSGIAAAWLRAFRPTAPASRLMAEEAVA